MRDDNEPSQWYSFLYGACTAVLICLLVVVLQGCSLTGAALDAVNPLKEEKGINVDAQVGKNNTLHKKKQLVESNINASEKNVVTGTQSITKSTNIPWWALCIATVVGVFVNPINLIREYRMLPRKR